MNFSIVDVHPFHQIFISLVLGLLIGLQRQWAGDPVGGIRTFPLISLFGTATAFLSAQFGNSFVIAGLVSVLFVAILGAYLKKNKFDSNHSGLVTELSMLLTYAIGVIVFTGPVWLGAMLTGVTAVLLHAKLELHGISQRFTEKEIRAIMQFVLISIVIFPIVPDQRMGPFSVINPHEIWLMVVLIVAISLSAYTIYKFFGEKAGIILGGILGGAISSTATTVTYSKRSAADGAAGAINANLAIIFISWSVLYLRIFLEILVAAPEFHEIRLPLGIIFLVSLVSGIWIFKNSFSSEKGMPDQQNPAELKTALTFGFIYAVIILAVAFAKNVFGTQGLSVVALLSGVTDMDAITLSTSRLVNSQALSAIEGARIIILALFSNVFFKGMIILTLGKKPLFKKIIIPWGLTLLTSLILYWQL